jgi:hypothetical protein
MTILAGQLGPLGSGKKRGPSLDPDALAFLTAAGITDPTQTAAIDALVVSLKSDGLWTKMHTIYPFVGGSASSHAVNLKSPGTYDGTFLGGWVHAATGVKPNGGNGKMDTNYRYDLAGVGIADTHWASYIREATGAGAELGNGAGQGEILLGGYGGLYADWPFFPNRLQGTMGAPGLYSGHTGPTTSDVFRNGVHRISGAAASGAHEPHTLTVGGGYLNSRWSTAEQAFVSFGTALTAGEHADLYTAVQTFQTTLGRQV